MLISLGMGLGEKYGVKFTNLKLSDAAVEVKAFNYCDEV
jgi:hypothetical protein